MSSNLYKSGWVVLNSQDVRVIDNNSRLERKLDAALHVASLPVDEPVSDTNEFSDGLEAEAVDILLAPEGAGDVIKNVSEEEKAALLEEIEAAKSELAALQEQAGHLLEDAKSEIASMQMKAYEEAKNQGYQEGKRLGRLEVDTAKAEYESKIEQLDAEYQQKIKELEPEFIDTLTGIYEHIFKVDLSRYKELIINLLGNAMLRIETSAGFLVHVSKKDYENVLSLKDSLKAEIGSMSLEIIEDMTLAPTQCYIETENGIYDCGLDTQLKELARKLRLLSYEK